MFPQTLPAAERVLSPRERPSATGLPLWSLTVRTVTLVPAIWLPCAPFPGSFHHVARPRLRVALCDRQELDRERQLPHDCCQPWRPAAQLVHRGQTC